MRTVLVALLASSLLAATAVAGAKPKAGPAKAPAGGVTDATVSAAVTEFVDSLNSLDDNRVLSAIAPADRGALKGRENLIGIIYPNKLATPKVNSWEKVENGGKTIGALAKITVEATDSLEGVKAAREMTWFLALDGNALKVSVASVWLDADMVRER